LQHLGLRSPKASPAARAKVVRAPSVQAQQALLHGGRQLAGAQRQRGRLVVEGVDDIRAVGAGQAVVQGQE
jgi:hypothetical protein